MKLYEPQPSDPQNPSVVVEIDGVRLIVKSNGFPETAWDRRQPYSGAVRRDPIASALRGLAWSLGVPGGREAEVPESAISMR